MSRETSDQELTLERRNLGLEHLDIKALDLLVGPLTQNAVELRRLRLRLAVALSLNLLLLGLLLGLLLAILLVLVATRKTGRQ